MKNVLLIDDEEIANYLSELIVRRTGVFDKIDICLHGKEALEHLRHLQQEGQPGPQLILLDINMPVMNGYEFLGEFSKLPVTFTSDIKIAVLTSSINEKDRLRALEYGGVVDFINKPLSVESVASLLTRIFPVQVT